MGYRITKKMLEKKMESVNKFLNRPTTYATKNSDGTYTTNIGHLVLDHNSIYGGYVVEEVISDGGGRNNSFMGVSHRVNASTMWDMLEAFTAGVTQGRI